MRWGILISLVSFTFYIACKGGPRRKIREPLNPFVGFGLVDDETTQTIYNKQYLVDPIKIENANTLQAIYVNLIVNLSSCGTDPEEGKAIFQDALERNQLHVVPSSEDNQFVDEGIKTKMTQQQKDPKMLFWDFETNSYDLEVWTDEKDTQTQEDAQLALASGPGEDMLLPASDSKLTVSEPKAVKKPDLKTLKANIKAGARDPRRSTKAAAPISVDTKVVQEYQSFKKRISGQVPPPLNASAPRNSSPSKGRLSSLKAATIAKAAGALTLSASQCDFTPQLDAQLLALKERLLSNGR